MVDDLADSLLFLDLELAWKFCCSALLKVRQAALAQRVGSLWLPLRRRECCCFCNACKARRAVRKETVGETGRTRDTHWMYCTYMDSYHTEHEVQSD